MTYTTPTSIILRWSQSQEDEVFLYTIEYKSISRCIKIANNITIHGNQTKAEIGELEENTEYVISIGAINPTGVAFESVNATTEQSCEFNSCN